MYRISKSTMLRNDRYYLHKKFLGLWWVKFSRLNEYNLYKNVSFSVCELKELILKGEYDFSPGEEVTYYFAKEYDIFELIYIKSIDDFNKKFCEYLI